MNVRFEVHGLEEVYRKMERLANARIADKAVELYAKSIMADVDDYPPETDANLPPAPYYKRGYGTVTNAGGTGRKTSEAMGRKWHVKATSSLISLENDARYSGYVQGAKQALFHFQRGWKNAYIEADRRVSEVEDIFRDLVRKNWR
jgi:hypothetical protein